VEYPKSALKRLERAEKLLTKGLFEEALVYAHWAVELALRGCLEKYGLDVTVLEYSGLCDNVLRLGVIDRDERETLRWLGNRRNVAYHRAGTVSKADARKALDFSRACVEKFGGG
jgi:HEPN domain-containing protein